VPALLARHVAVLVGGLGSTSDTAAIDRVDVGALGYAPGDVLRFSYAGGRTPAPSGAAPSRDLRALPSATYSAEDTLDDLALAGGRLAALLTEVVNATPIGAPVDVLAHSQGGIVTRVALADLARDRPDVLARLGTVVTLGTPHQGADLAALVQALDAQPVDHAALAELRAEAGIPLRPDAVAVQQLAPGSALLESLGDPPDGVRLVSIAARGDLVVPSPRTRIGGTDPIVVPVDGIHAHDELPGSAAATREIGLALAGMGPTCQGAADAVGDAAIGDLVMNGERLLTATAP
jgi:triacylglycerol esterase/lipase EstA (alpha/beta hydrolase family)